MICFEELINPISLAVLNTICILDFNNPDFT